MSDNQNLTAAMSQPISFPDSMILPKLLRKSTTLRPVVPDQIERKDERLRKENRLLDVWVVGIPSRIREHPKYTDSPRFKNAQWGITGNPHIAKACMKAWGWLVWRVDCLKSWERDEIDNVLDEFREYYTMYEAKDNKVLIWPQPGSPINGAWIQIYSLQCTENLVRAMVFDTRVKMKLEFEAEGRYVRILKAFETGDLRYAYPTPTQEAKAIFETQCWVLDSYWSPDFSPGKRAPIEMTPPSFQLSPPSG